MTSTARAADTAETGKHPVDQVPPLARLAPLGLQHVLAMYAGAVAVPLVVGSALIAAGRLEPGDLAYLISADLLVAGIATLIQSISFWRFGVRLPLMQGCTFAAVSPMIAIGSQYGVTAIYGSVHRLRPGRRPGLADRGEVALRGHLRRCGPGPARPAARARGRRRGPRRGCWAEPASPCSGWWRRAVRTLSRVRFNNANVLVVAISIGVGLLPTVSPELYTQFPSWFQIIFNSGISAGALTAILLNLVFNSRAVQARHGGDEGEFSAHDAVRAAAVETDAAVAGRASESAEDRSRTSEQ